MASQAPQSLGRYEIQKEIGRGMMGVVYEAVDPALGRTVALKAIELGFTLSREEHETFEERFLVEARTAARLSHANIMVIHDVGRDESTEKLFMALEYLQGRTLADVIRRGPPLDWRDALRITARLALGLDHAHRHGVIHRDIKPGNIMLLPTGEPKLMDFGIAKIEAARVQLTMAGQFFGTPLYMSPEQALGETVDRTTDIFSLGSVAYSLLAGRPAFWAETIPRVVALVAHGSPPPPSQFAPALPVRVDRVIARAMARKPSERYASGKDMAEEIEGVLDLDRLLEGHPAPPAWPDAGMETQLERLAGPVDTEEGSEPRDQRPPEMSVLFSTVTWRHAHLPKPRAWGLGLLLLGLAAVLLWLLPSSLHLGSQTGASLSLKQSEVLAAGVPEPTPSATQSAAPAAVGMGPSAKSSLAPSIAAQTTRLSVRLEHSVKHGVYRVRVDRELVAEGSLDSDTTRTIRAFAFRRGDTREFLDLPGGDHTVEVQVLWDGKEKTGRIWGHFDAGSTRYLRARLGGLFKRLSVEWD